MKTAGYPPFTNEYTACTFLQHHATRSALPTSDSSLVSDPAAWLPSRSANFPKTVTMSRSRKHVCRIVTARFSHSTSDFVSVNITVSDGNTSGALLL